MTEPYDVGVPIHFAEEVSQERGVGCWTGLMGKERDEVAVDAPVAQAVARRWAVRRGVLDARPLK